MSLLKRFLKRIRYNHLINWVGRSFLKGAATYSSNIRNIQRFWPVAGTVKLMIDGVEFKSFAHCDDHILNNLYYQPSYEVGELKLTKLITKQNNCLIDVGANTGLYSIFAAKCNPNLQILAFEPHPTNYQRLITNISINQINIITPIKKAVGNAEGEIAFFIPQNESISDISSVSKEFSESIYKEEFKKITVELVKLDSYQQTLKSKIGLLKIDVEGYEYEVLKGAHKILHRDRPMIICEIFSAFYNDTKEFERLFPKVSQIQLLLFELGYSIYEIGSNTLKFLPSFNQPHHNRNYLLTPKYLGDGNIPINEELNAIL